MEARRAYFQTLLRDAEDLSQDPNVIAALVVADALNGWRKALISLTEVVKSSQFDAN